MGAEMKRTLETAMRNRLLRHVLCAITLAGTVLLGGCDEDIGVSGVGASVGLPSAFVSSATDPTDIGVGNVHWVGNPRW
jgi:hypothetical protein